MRASPLIALLTLASTAALAQAQPKPVQFDAADVHASPANNVVGSDGGALRGDRYVLRQATLVDIIAKAYSLDPANIQGGPPWLEMSRYDIVAATTPGASPASLKLMLQSLFAERFALTTHTGAKTMPAYILTLGKSKPKLKEAGTGDPGCDNKDQQPTASGVRQNALACHNKTMDNLAEDLHGFAGGYLDKPVVNSTNLEGAWDYDLIWTARGQLAKAGSDGISIFDAVDKELGLKLELQTAPRPVLFVDSVREQPTPNSPDLARLLPPLPPATFDVAVIKPAKPGTDNMQGRMTKDQVNLQNVNLKFLIAVAWNFNPQENDRIIGPKWLDTDRFDILAKLNVEAAVASNNNVAPVDTDDFLHMIQALIAERFKMQSHTEQRELLAYTLTAATPKLKPAADPTARTRCENGPGPDGKDPRIANPVLSRLVSCQNMTMPQIARKFQEIAGGYISGDVLDRTGLTGSYDFTLSFSGAGQFQGGVPSSDTASDPNGALTLFEAVNRQLGLKLEKQKRPVSVLVIDHIDEKPTEN